MYFIPSISNWNDDLTAVETYVGNLLYEEL